MQMNFFYRFISCNRWLPGAILLLTLLETTIRKMFVGMTGDSPYHTVECVCVCVRNHLLRGTIVPLLQLIVYYIIYCTGTDTVDLARRLWLAHTPVSSSHANHSELTAIPSRHLSRA